MKHALATFTCALAGLIAQPAAAPVPAYPMQFAAFSVRFGADGAFLLQGAGWPTFRGTWKAAGGNVEILTPDGRGGGDTPARYRVRTENARTTFDVIEDACQPRRMILDRSTWHADGVKDA